MHLSPGREDWVWKGVRGGRGSGRGRGGDRREIDEVGRERNGREDGGGIGWGGGQ